MGPGLSVGDGGKRLVGPGCQWLGGGLLPPLACSTRPGCSSTTRRGGGTRRGVWRPRAVAADSGEAPPATAALEGSARLGFFFLLSLCSAWGGKVPRRRGVAPRPVARGGGGDLGRCSGGDGGARRRGAAA
ncbi:Os09g0561200 [Oryza sativa Japonica Group]|uniref:Os09g0561200 protein n=2 Tax=Oryza sativa subsp. japonica TaxID=39947 RepID=Q653D3_ORYSJ|nr:hypothetical protein [Oryza sativa Japonica Group]BAT09406.1 Os09g0561200 [Oryza sativa Japonica Group]